MATIPLLSSVPMELLPGFIKKLDNPTWIAAQQTCKVINEACMETDRRHFVEEGKITLIVSFCRIPNPVQQSRFENIGQINVEMNTSIDEQAQIAILKPRLETLRNKVLKEMVIWEHGISDPDRLRETFILVSNLLREHTIKARALDVTQFSEGDMLIPLINSIQPVIIRTLGNPLFLEAASPMLSVKMDSKYLTPFILTKAVYIEANKLKRNELELKDTVAGIIEHLKKDHGSSKEICCKKMKITLPLEMYRPQSDQCIKLMDYLRCICKEHFTDFQVGTDDPFELDSTTFCGYMESGLKSSKGKPVPILIILRLIFEGWPLGADKQNVCYFVGIELRFINEKRDLSFPVLKVKLRKQNTFIAAPSQYDEMVENIFLDYIAPSL